MATKDATDLQAQILDTVRQTQAVAVDGLRSWTETVKQFTPKPAAWPLADQLPTPAEAVDSVFDLAGQLLAAQRQFVDRVEVAERLHIGSEHRALMVDKAVLQAERPHERTGTAQVRPWHAGEQVMLDLVVEPAEREVHHPAPAHVAGRQHLAAEVVQLVRFGEHRHALVVGGERAAQVEAEQALLDDDEDR